MHDSNLNDRLNSVRDTTNEKKLKDYAINNPSEEVREIAVSKITDPAVLSFIIKNETSLDVAKAALKNIDDEHELKNLFMEISDNQLSSGCYLKKSEKEIYINGVCLEIIGKITNKSYLIEIYGVKRIIEILHRIHEIDPRILFITRNGKVITHQKDLAKIIDTIRKDDFDISLITSQNVLEKIARDSRDSTYRRFAVEKITNQNVLEEIALNDPHFSVRREATKKIENQNLLKEIALNDSDFDVRGEATKKIENQDFLEEMALKYLLWNDGETIKRIENQKTLKQMAMRFSDCSMRLEAIERIENQDFLKEIAMTDSCLNVRRQANAKINDQHILLEISLSNELENTKFDDETKILYDALKRVVG